MVGRNRSGKHYKSSKTLSLHYIPRPFQGNTVKWAEKGEMLRYDPEEAPTNVVPKKRPKTTERAQGNLPP